MAAIAQPKKYADLISDMNATKKAFNDALSKLGGLPVNDARRIAITQCRSMLNTLVFVAIRLCIVAEKNLEQFERIADVLGIEGTPDCTVEQQTRDLLDQLNLASRGAFVAQAQFALESGIRQMLEFEGRLPAKEGFAALVGVAFLGDQTKIHAVSVPAKIRNSLHDNGHHSKTDWSTIVDGVDYEFIKGKQVECASWRHILHLYKNIIHIYADFFQSGPATLIPA